MSTDSYCLTGIFGLVVVLLLLNLHANFFNYQITTFFCAFFPNLSPACEMPDCNAFLANGLTTV